MIWKKLRRLTCLGLCIALFCCSCAATEPIGSGSEIDVPYIGIVLKSTDNPYFALIKAGAEYEADQVGAQVVIAAPEKEDNVKEQTALVESMSKLDTDVIIVSPSNEQSITEELKKAKEKGKRILTVDTSSDFDDCDGYIGTDQYAAARKQGAYAAKLIDDEDKDSAKAVILRGADGDKTHMLREYGIEDGLEDGGISVSSVEYCDCKEDIAEDTMEELLKKDKKDKKIRIVCTTSDSMAVGAQRAIAESGREDIHIVSFDGMIDASELVRVGEIDAVFAQDPYEMGKQCIDYAVKLWNGEYDGESVHIDVELITSNNAEAHISELQRELDHWDGK